MKKLSYKAIDGWMRDRAMIGINSEEFGSCDSLEDADGFFWWCTVDEEDGRKVVRFTTSQNPVPFATARLTKTGRVRISWN